MSNLLKKEKNLHVLKPKTIIITDRQQAAQMREQRRNDRIAIEVDEEEGAKSLTITVGKTKIEFVGAEDDESDDNNVDSVQVLCFIRCFCF